MKKTLVTFGLTLMCATGAFAQSTPPSCQNDNGLEGRIDGIEAGGWVEISRTFYPVLYKIAPTPPYLIGTMEILFGKACDPGEPCPEIAKLYREDAIQQSQNTCVWTPNHN